MAEPQAQRLRGRRFLVTGGSGGIGRAVAERLTSELGEVVILDINRSMLEIGRESVNGEASDALLAEAAEDLAREAMQ